MRHRLPIAVGLAIASTGMFFYGGYLMASRIADYNRAKARPVFAFQEVSDQQFSFAGRDVSFSDADDPDGWKLVVRFGDDELRLPVQIPGDRRLPGLLPHRDWMRILRFAQSTNIDTETLQKKIDAGEIRDRLVVVTRNPRPGADPATWGRVWRKDTLFHFYEFLPDGGFAHERLAYPHTRQNQPAAEGELKDDTWQLQAALHVIPPGMGPKVKYREESMHAMGWTWTIAFAGVSGMIAAVVVGAGIRTRKRPAEA